MLLRAGYIAVAYSLQEAAGMSGNEFRGKLQQALGDKGTYVDHIGDEESGDCIMGCDPDGDGDTDMMAVPYSKGTESSDTDYSMDHSKARPVALRTSWEDQPDEADHYAGMQESGLYTKGGTPLCERFVSKKERDAATGGSFAGKGKSFPILKAADVKAAAASIGRAGAGNYSTDVIRKNIIRIAKEKGFEAELPKAWQDGTSDSAPSKEAAKPGVELFMVRESAMQIDTVMLREAAGRANYEVKLISPGPGSMAYYTPEVLKRDGPGAFPAETKVYLNHPPTDFKDVGNRDVHRLAGVLSEAAHWDANHAKGPGLYSRVKVFADHSELMGEKAQYLAMSIMANGVLAKESGSVVKRDGVPVLERLAPSQFNSVDVVPLAGAGGMILTESAKADIPTQEAAGMSAEEVKKLVESALVKDRLPEVARAEATRLLEGISLKPETKQDIIEGVLRGTIPVKEDGSLNAEALGPLVVAEAQRIGRILSREVGTGVRGMGIAPAAPAPKPEEIAAREAARVAEETDMVSVYESMGMPHNAAVFAAKGRAA